MNKVLKGLNTTMLNNPKVSNLYWFIKYYVPNENQIKIIKKNKKYKNNWKETAHLLEPISSNHYNCNKLHVSSDLFVEGKKNPKYRFGKEIESIILSSKLLVNLKEINFRLGFLYRGLPYGWLKSNSSQDKYIQEKLDQCGWFTPKIDIKNRILLKRRATVGKAVKPRGSLLTTNQSLVARRLER